MGEGLAAGLVAGNAEVFTRIPYESAVSATPRIFNIFNIFNIFALSRRNSAASESHSPARLRAGEWGNSLRSSASHCEFAPGSQ